MKTDYFIAVMMLWMDFKNFSFPLILLQYFVCLNLNDVLNKREWPLTVELSQAFIEQWPLKVPSSPGIWYFSAPSKIL